MVYMLYTCILIVFMGGILSMYMGAAIYMYIDAVCVGYVLDSREKGEVLTGIYIHLWCIFMVLMGAIYMYIDDVHGW